MELHKPDLLVKIHLLGQFRILIKQDEIRLESWRSKKALSLFKYLVSKMGVKVPTSVLLDLLWPEMDSTEDDVKHRLHSTVYVMRKTLDKALNTTDQKLNLIAYADGVYWFEPNPLCWVDTVEFEMHYRLGMEYEYTNPSSAIGHYISSIELYKGDFLSEEPYEDWATGYREHYREIYINATIRAAELLAQENQDFTKAVQICRNALRVDPYREELHQAIMENLIRAGRFAEAGYQYRQCMRMLYDEFGLEPSPDTQSLFEEMKRLNCIPEVYRDTQDKCDLKKSPFICDRKTFESVYQLEIRRQPRSEEPLSIITVYISKKGGMSLRNSIISTLTTTLRQGDVLCVWDSNRILIQLPHTGQKACLATRRRLENILQSKGLTQIYLSTSTLSSVNTEERDYFPLEELLPKSPPRAMI